MKAMILAAGKGTRLKPLTNNIPKPLIEILGKPMLQYTIEYLKKHGINEIVINVHHLAEQIINFLETNNYFDITIHISDEQNKLLDTGGGIKNAGKYLNAGDDFIVMACDVFTNLNLQKLIAFHKNNPGSLATLAVKKRETTRNLLFDSQFQLCGWRNNLTGEQIIAHERNKYEEVGFSAIQVLSPRIFKLFPDEDSFPIMKFYLSLAANEKIMGFKHNNNAWLELGRTENLHNPEFINKLSEIQ